MFAVGISKMKEDVLMPAMENFSDYHGYNKVFATQYIA